jgi:outer membrane biosynthesis protein TonB
VQFQRGCDADEKICREMAERLQSTPAEPLWLLEDFVKTKIQSLSFLATLAVVLGLISWGSSLNAQTTPSTPTDQQTTQPTPTPDTPATPQTQPTPKPDNPPAAQQTPNAQAPDAAQPAAPKDSTPTAAAPGAGDSQVFSGTVEKSGDKYVLKTDAGKTYDIDHQDDVKKFEGKKVRVQGKLDETGTKIQVK